jgi:hypothetical protein
MLTDASAVSNASASSAASPPPSPPELPAAAAAGVAARPGAAAAALSSSSSSSASAPPGVAVPRDAAERGGGGGGGGVRREAGAGGVRCCDLGGGGGGGGGGDASGEAGVATPGVPRGDEGEPPFSALFPFLAISKDMKKGPQARAGTHTTVTKMETGNLQPLACARARHAARGTRRRRRRAPAAASGDATALTERGCDSFLPAAPPPLPRKSLLHLQRSTITRAAQLG